MLPAVRVKKKSSSSARALTGSKLTRTLPSPSLIRVRSYSSDDHGEGSESHDVSPLHAACRGDDADEHTVRSLLAAGADVLEEDQEGNGALHYACRGSKCPIGVVKLLIEHKVDVNRINNKCVTPISLACEKGHAAIVDLLLSSGADAAIPNKDGITPLCIACSKGHQDVVRILLKTCKGLVRSVKLDCEPRLLTPLLAASDCNYLEIVIMLLASGEDANEMNSRGLTALYVACKKGHASIVKALLSAGADPDYINSASGDSPLYAACAGNHLDIVQLLLEVPNCEIDCKNNNRWTPLYVASHKGHHEIVSLLLDAGADFSVQNLVGQTPLYISSEKGYADIVNSLILHGASACDATDQCNEQGGGRSPLYIAALRGHTKVVDILLRHGAPVNSIDRNGQTALMIACGEGHLDIVKLLVSHRADVRMTNNVGITALYMACEKDNWDVVQYLLTVGADVNVSNKYGLTPLYVACLSGKLDVVKQLLHAGATANQFDADGFTPLLASCRGEYSDVVALLIEHGAQVDSESIVECTPLGMAAMRNNVDIARILLGAGADVNAVNSAGVRPPFIALDRMHWDVLMILLDCKPDLTALGLSPLISPCAAGHIDVVRKMVEVGVDVNAADECGRTPLYVACELGNTDIVGILLSHRNIDKDVEGKGGNTPLLIASSNGHLAVVEALIAAGADTYLTNHSGISPLHAACSAGYANIARALIIAGADINRTGNINWTPLYIAVKKGHIDVAKELISAKARVNISSKSYDSPLFVASMSGRADIVKILLEAGADIEMTNNTEMTSLLIASLKGHVAVVDILLKCGANFRHVDDTGATALYLACSAGQLGVVKLLAPRMGDVNESIPGSYPPLYGACAAGCANTVAYLLSQGAKVNCEPPLVSRNIDCKLSKVMGKMWHRSVEFAHDASSYHNSSLVVASERGHFEVVTLLIAAAADVDVINADGITPLIAASNNGHLRIVKALIAASASLRFSDNDMNSPLFSSCSNGHIDVAKELLLAGASVNTTNKDGCTPLYTACWNGHMLIVKALLLFGADVEICNKDGWTPLMASSFMGDKRITSLLLQEGADVSKLNKDGHSALQIARPNVTNILLNASIESSILKACVQGDGITVQRLMKANKKDFPKYFNESTAPTLASKTPFMVACSLGLPDNFLVNMLLRNLPVGAAYGRGPQFFDFRNRELNFPSIRYNVPIYSSRSGEYEHCKVYFECTLRSRGVLRLGIASSAWCPQKAFQGVGNDALSYGLDGWSGCVWHMGSISLESDFKWDKHNVIGVTIDTQAEAVLFHRNGIVINGIPNVDLSEVFRSGSVVPVCSFDSDMEALFNFGSHAFSYGLPVEHDKDPDDIELSIVLEDQWFSLDDYYRKYHVDFLTINPQGRSCTPPRTLELFDSSANMWKIVTSASRLMRPCPAYDWCWAVSHDEPRTVRLVTRILEERSSEVEELATCEDENGRRAIDIAAPSCRRAMQSFLFFLGQYEIVPGPALHTSASCTVILAIDHGNGIDGKSSDQVARRADPMLNSQRGRRVALKFMRHWGDFERELVSRVGTDSKFVVPVIASYADTHAVVKFQNNQNYPDGVSISGRYTHDCERLGLDIYPFLLVLPACTFSLADMMLHGHIAPSDRESIRGVVRDLALALSELHRLGRIHGDVKPLNILRRTDGHVQLIDLDASARIDFREPCGCKLSSGYIPPEMVSIVIRDGCDIDAMQSSPSTSTSVRPMIRAPCPEASEYGYCVLEASPSYDMWSLGCVMYYMYTGETLWQVTHDDNLVDEHSLLMLAEWEMEVKLRKLSKISDPVARNLVSQLLSKNPKLRPDCDHILRHGFITGHVALGRMPGEEPEFDVFLSYRVASDATIAEQVYDVLSAAGVRVWWDKRCLQPGELWEIGFCRGLAGSRVFLPLLSRDGINNHLVPWQNFSVLLENSECDNVLLEYRLALELKERGMIEKVCPVFVGDKLHCNSVTTTEYCEYLFRDDLGNGLTSCHPICPDVVVQKVEEKLLQHLEGLGLGSPLKNGSRASVKSVLDSLVASQGLFIRGPLAEAINQVATDIKLIVDNLPETPNMNNGSNGARTLKGTGLGFNNALVAEKEAAVSALASALFERDQIAEERDSLLRRLSEQELLIKKLMRSSSIQ